ncbi:MAG: rhomboid family intramembrane serine protease, partial [Planctomycetes bacterium]|nr:rhomboid family intramembrane serine protease [Planctomycetota bacterium]
MLYIVVVQSDDCLSFRLCENLVVIIPYSTDAPIYYFPWTTILVVITNAVVFVLTGYGHHPGHWFLEFGNGLHPLQWFTFSFVHRHWLPLLETMFFFWTFGIVVEGKLGWWKFLSLYFGINLVCGMFVQTVMLGYGTVDEVALRSNDQTIWSVFDPPSAWAQDDDVDDVGVDDEVMNADEDAPDDAEPNGPAPNLIPNRRGGDNDELTDEDKQFLEDLEQDGKPGIGGAMFIVFAMLGIILVWAPKNEVSCLFLFGRFGGTVELEFLFFCGLKIFFEIMNCCFMLMLSALIPGLYAATEVANLFSVCFGFAIGTISVRKGWVDCENWDLFAY